MAAVSEVGAAAVPPPVKKRSGRWEKVAVPLILAAFAGALVYLARATGVTVDEPSHLVSAALYWKGADRLRPGDMPPLIKIAGGWIPASMPLRIPADAGREGDKRHEWDIALGMMLSMPLDEIRRTFFRSRLPFVMFSLLTAVVLWRWSRALFGPATAVFVLLAFTLEPTVLGHGPLFKNDLAAAFCYLLFWYAGWTYAKRPSLFRAAALGGALGLALISKLSMLFLIPVGLLLLLAAARRSGIRLAASSVALTLAPAYLIVIAAYQFDARRLTAAELAAYRENAFLSQPIVTASHVFRVVPVPARMWDGMLALMDSNGREMPIYLFGRYHWHGTPAFFPAALSVKAPEVLLLLVACGGAVAMAGLRRRRWSWPDACWLLPGFLYAGLASFSALQFGVRLILPALPFGLLLAGVALRSLLESRARWTVPCLFAVLGVQTAAAFPHYVAFFNASCGGPKNGIRYLSGSNLDWGQGLPQLAAWVRENRIPRIRLSYFGTDHPWAYLREDEIEPLTPPYTEASPTRLQPEPGFYAISASLLPGQFVHPKRRDYYEAFRSMTPVAMAAESIYVYQVR